MNNSLNRIKKYAQKIKEEFHPEKIILFGSYAYGTPTQDSDVDLCIIMETKISPLKQAVAIRKKIPSPFALDLIVKTPKEVKNRLKQEDFFLKNILNKGKIL